MTKRAPPKPDPKPDRRRTAKRLAAIRDEVLAPLGGEHAPSHLKRLATVYASVALRLEAITMDMAEERPIDDAKHGQLVDRLLKLSAELRPLGSPEAVAPPQWSDFELAQRCAFLLNKGAKEAGLTLPGTTTADTTAAPTAPQAIEHLEIPVITPTAPPPAPVTVEHAYQRRPDPWDDGRPDQPRINLGHAAAKGLRHVH